MTLALPFFLFMALSLFAIPVFMVLWVLICDIGGVAQKEDVPASTGMGCQAVPVMWLGQVFGWSVTSATQLSFVGALAGGLVAVLLFFGYSFFSVRKSEE